METEDYLAIGIVSAAVIIFFWITGITSIDELLAWYDVNGMAPVAAACVTVAIALVAIYVEDNALIILALSAIDLCITFSAILG